MRLGQHVRGRVRHLQPDPAEPAVALDDAAKHAIFDDNRADPRETLVEVTHVRPLYDAIRLLHAV